MMEGYVSSLEVAFFVPARKMTILLEESLKKKSAVREYHGSQLMG